MARCVDAAAGIGVLQPGSADVAVLLDDREGDAGLPQLDAGTETGEASADDDDAEVLGRRRVRHDEVALGHPQFLGQQGPDRRRQRVARTEGDLEHLRDALRRGRLCRRLARPPGHDEFEGRRTDIGLHVGREAAGVVFLGAARRGRAPLRPEPGVVAAQGGHGHEQRREVGLVEGGPEVLG
jgi:hypothetical protein